MFGKVMSQGWAGGVVVVLLLADFVVGFSAKADLHHSLARQYTGLQRKALKAEADKADKIHDEMLGISVDEPPAYMALEADCCNQALWARDGKTAESYPNERVIEPWYRYTMHILRHSGTDFPYRKDISTGSAAGRAAGSESLVKPVSPAAGE